MAETAKQNYELAYHLNSNFDTEGVQKKRMEIENFITSDGGVILYSKEPERIKLSYHIKHQQASYFGYLHFNVSDSELLEKVRDYMRLNPDFLRFLLIKFEPEKPRKKEDIVRKMAAAEKKRLKAAKEAAKPAKELLKSSDKEIDQKLEEIIEKL